MKSHFILTVGLCAISSFALAGVCSYQPGRVVCGHGTVDSVTAAGEGVFNGTTVSNLTQVFGALHATDATFHEVKTEGSADFNHSTLLGSGNFSGGVILNNTQVKSSVQAAGGLSATNSTFTQTLHIASSDITISSSQTKDIIFNRTEHYGETLTLRNHTTVNGNITFESGHGVVMKSADSAISGKVIGGKIITN